MILTSKECFRREKNKGISKENLTYFTLYKKEFWAGQM